MGTTTYSKDNWDNGATTNSKVTRTMGKLETMGHHDLQ